MITEQDKFRDPYCGIPRFDTLVRLEAFLNSQLTIIPRVAALFSGINLVGTFWYNGSSVEQLGAVDTTKLKTVRRGVVDTVTDTEHVVLLAGSTLTTQTFGRVTDTSAAVAAKELGDRKLTISGLNCSWTGACAGIAPGDVIYCIDDMALSIGNNTRSIQLNANASVLVTFGSGIYLTGTGTLKIGNNTTPIFAGATPGWITCVDDYMACGANLHTQSNAASQDNEADATTGWSGVNVTLTSILGGLRGNRALLATATAASSARAEYQFAATVGCVYMMRCNLKSIPIGPLGAAFEVNGCTNVTGSYYERGMDPTFWRQISALMTATGTPVTLRLYPCRVTGTVGDQLLIDAFSVRRVFGE